jgi:hypothetical protein
VRLETIQPTFMSSTSSFTTLSTLSLVASKLAGTVWVGQQGAQRTVGCALVEKRSELPQVAMQQGRHGAANMDVQQTGVVIKQPLQKAAKHSQSQMNPPWSAFWLMPMILAVPQIPRVGACQDASVSCKGKAYSDKRHSKS